YPHRGKTHADSAFAQGSNRQWRHNGHSGHVRFSAGAWLLDDSRRSAHPLPRFAQHQAQTTSHRGVVVSAQGEEKKPVETKWRSASLTLRRIVRDRWTARTCPDHQWTGSCHVLSFEEFSS